MSLLSIFNNFRLLLKGISPKQQKEFDKIKHLQALLLSKNNDRKHLSSISDAEFKVYSQWGEDGIIDWVISLLPGIPECFIEFGVESYLESNTRYLLRNKNWRGLVLDGSEENIKAIRGQEIYWQHDLTAVNAFIDKENINTLIVQNDFNGDLGLLSIDIDGNDYWVWESINAVKPWIVICEYNAVLGDKIPLTIPYDKNFKRNQFHFSNLYFGASLPALIQLASEKGYTFIGSCSAGCNAFFICNEKASLIMSKLDEIIAYPSCFRESRDINGDLTYMSGPQRFELISKMTLMTLNKANNSLESSKERSDENYEVFNYSSNSDLYSEQWLNGSKRKL